MLRWMAKAMDVFGYAAEPMYLICMVEPVLAHHVRASPNEPSADRCNVAPFHDGAQRMGYVVR